MSLEVRHLTKTFGGQVAVKNISFSVGKGEVVGFLGPNGAGKSTTMKIAMGYIPPTSGTVLVGGHDVVQHSLKVRKMSGYLPENNPLYPDMYVHEYLRFSGELFGMRGRVLKNKVKEMISLCGLQPEQNKKIESLSKGYRQRVGIAQALLHDPEVLILDEPTSGLDPNQLVEIRKLIREVSLSKTVVFSTHIMQEVHALCSRVIVINKGEIAADSKLEDLVRNSELSATTVVEFAGGVPVDDLRQIDGVKSVEEISSHCFRIVAFPDKDVRAAIFRFAAERQLSLVGLKQETSSLEGIFKELTSSKDEGNPTQG